MGDATADQEVLLSLLGRTKAVLFDFDGPVCALFGGLPKGPSGRSRTKGVADEIKQAARKLWDLETLTPEVEGCDDSHDLLQRLRVMYEADPTGLGPLPLKVAEDIVAQAEEEAVKTAEPARGIDDLMGLLSDLGMPLAIVSNNAEGPIRAFLDRPDLLLGSKIDGVFGRDPDDARLMKPEPHCVERAVEKLSLDASDCLVVGDKLSDLKAARAAGTCFLGYTQKPFRAAQMRTDGAAVVVSSHQPVIEAARKLTEDRRASYRTCR